jgi:hypothetical protein
MIPHVATRTWGGTRAETAWMVGFIALGVGLRVHGIASHPLWIDEYGTWWALAGEGPGDLWQRVITVHGQSPLYYLIVSPFVAALGPTPLALRLPSLIFGIALLFLMVPLARAALGDRVAIAALAALAVNERLIFYSQEARPYALALFCAALSGLAWLSLLRDPRSSRARAGYWVATTASFYAHYLFGLLVVVQAAHWLAIHARPLLRSSERAELRAWLPIVAVLALALLPGALQLGDLFGRRELLDWVAPTPPLELLRIYFDASVLAWTGGAVLLAVLVARAVTVPTRLSAVGFVALWLAVPFVAITLLPPLFGISLLDRRYVAVALPAVPLVYGILMTLPGRGSRLAWLPLAVFLCASAVLTLVPRYQATGLFSTRYRGEHWARAAQSLRARHQIGQPIFYATHFVELDAVVRGQASEEDRSFSAWPVAAHIGPEQRAELRALPYSDTPEMTAVFQGRLDEASRVERSWVVGKQPVIARFIRLAVRHPGVEVVGHERFGKIYLVRLRGRAGSAAER